MWLISLALFVAHISALPQIRLTDESNLQNDVVEAAGKSCILRQFLWKGKKSWRRNDFAPRTTSPLVLKLRPNEYFNFLPRDILQRKQFRFSLPLTKELSELISPAQQGRMATYNDIEEPTVMRYRLQFVSNDLMSFLRARGQVKVKMIFTATPTTTTMATTTTTTTFGGIATDDFQPDPSLEDNNLLERGFDRAYKL